MVVVAVNFPHREADKAGRFSSKMACVPASSSAPPSQLHGGRRRLFDLLKEPQEPFLLDVYLAEKGYSDTLATSNFPCPVCWPAEPCSRVQARIKTRHRKPLRRRILSRRILNSWTDRAPLNESIHDVGFDLPPRIEEMFRELVEIAYTPAFYELIGSHDELIQSDKIAPDCGREAEDVLLAKWHGHEISTGEEVVHEEMTAPWMQEKLEQMIVSDISSSRNEWVEFQHQITQIRTEIEAKIFQDMEEEIILALMLGEKDFSSKNQDFDQLIPQCHQESSY